MGKTLLPRVSVAESLHRLTSVSTAEWIKTPNGGSRLERRRPPMPRFEAVSAVPDGVLDTQGDMHALAQTLASAYDLHLPVRLSPDQVWIVLAQGFATHVKRHSEQLRERFVRHAGQLTLQVRRDDFAPGAGNPWPELFQAFDEQLHAHLGKRSELVVADFSTTGTLERAVSQQVLMDAMQGYFDYELLSLCGIPRVTLTGTPEDWREIRTRARVFGEYELGWWIEALDPILDHFVAAAEGRVDVDHWSTIYKLKDDSGGPYLSGWFHVLFPYLVHLSSSGQRKLVPNPHLKNWHAGMSVDFGGGPTTADLPGAVSRVPLRWRYIDEVFDMELLAGFVGVHQEPDSLELSPQLGWAVRERQL